MLDPATLEASGASGSASDRTTLGLVLVLVAILGGVLLAVIARRLRRTTPPTTSAPGPPNRDDRD